MSILRKTEVDRKLSRGEPVTVEEIREDYAKYMPGPLGYDVVMTAESMKRIIDVVAKAQKKGLLLNFPDVSVEPRPDLDPPTATPHRRPAPVA